MKKINKFAAAIAVALSVGMTPQANAEIKFRPNGRGDALLFPVFNGYGENYFTIMNNHDAFIQGHLRFRGAAWSGELRDFDIILSPGDVFVFRVADIDGDGMWEIDQSLDIKNFQYTGLGGTPENKGMDGWTCSPKINPDMKIPRCMDPSDELVPSAKELAASLNKDISEAQAIIDYHTHIGYVEFLGEAVLDGLDYNIMEILLGNNPGEWRRHQTTIFSRRGTNAWVWSDASNRFAFDRKEEKDKNRAAKHLECDVIPNGTSVCNGLSDVPNALSGTAFLTIPGMSSGVAYNAEALVDFRTGDTAHRIDNYRVVTGASLDKENPNRMMANRAVILHHEDGASKAVGVSPLGDYVYQFVDGEWEDEAYMSFQNTWGPTLADGDDYNLAEGTAELDDDFDVSPWQSELQIVKDNNGIEKNQVVWSFYDHGLGRRNSVAEVEEAIRWGLYHANGPQVFSSYYFDGDLFDKSCEGNGTKMAGSSVSFCPTNPLVRSRPDEPSSVARTTLTSYYFAFFPTKVFYGHTWGGEYYNKVMFETLTNRFLIKGTTRDIALLNSISRALRLAKPVGLEIWDTFERTDKGMPKFDSSLSPALPAVCMGAQCTTRVLGHELSFFSIRDIKGWLDPDNETDIEDFRSGRVVITMADNNPNRTNEINWPGLMYTFEWDGDTTFAHWRPMHH